MWMWDLKERRSLKLKEGEVRIIMSLQGSWTELHSAKGICDVNITCQLAWAKECQGSFLGVSVRLPS